MRLFYRILSGLVLLWGGHVAFAEEAKPAELPTQPAFNRNALAVEWLFIGQLLDETDNRFSYFFLVQRKEDHLFLRTAIYNEEKQEQLFYYEAETKQDDLSQQRWQIGEAFLFFNPVNASWSVGVKTKDDNGFNLKIDVLSKASIEGESGQQHQTIQQTNRVIGHLNIASQPDLFVSANHNWLMQQKSQALLPQFFCDFDSGEALHFNADNLKQHQSGVVMLRLSKTGQPIKSIEKFSLDNQGNQWRVHSKTEKIEIDFNRIDSSQAKDLGALWAGFIQGKAKGFCVLHSK